MKDQRWMEETDPILLMLKLNEEVGEINHAFLRRDVSGVINECDDAALILERLRTVVRIDDIPEIRPDRYRST